MAYEPSCHEADIKSPYTAAIITNINDSVHWVSPHRSSVERMLANFTFRNHSATTTTEDEYPPQHNPAVSIWG